MRSTISISAVLAFLSIVVSFVSAGPIEVRAVKTVYTYVTAMSVGVIEPLAVPTDCATTVTAKGDCPAGCTHAPLPGLVGVATDAFTCLTPPPVPKFTHVTETSTCDPGSAVKTLSPWGAKTSVIACHATN